jgi:hypothetical protein
LNQCDGVLFKLAVVATRELASIGFHLLPFYFRSPVRKIEETSKLVRSTAALWGDGDPTPHQAGAWLLAIFRKLTATWHTRVFKQSPSDGTRTGAAQIHVGFDGPDIRQVSSRDVVGTQMHSPPTFRARNESLNCRRGLISGFGLRK